MLHTSKFYLIKYFFTVCISLIAVISNSESVLLVPFCILELLFVAVFTNLIFSKLKKIAYFFNSLLFFVINLQYATLFWGSSFINLQMLSNLTSAQDLYGNAGKYGITILLLLIFSLLPVSFVRGLKASRKLYFVFYLIFLVYLCGCTFFSFHAYSPSISFCTVVFQFFYRNSVSNDSEEELEVLKNKFYKATIEDCIERPACLDERPNIILLFTEGLSQNIIDDPRNIMPNIKEFQNKSLNFTNYYNHTFATYMGLQGQLYSGYNKNNLDKNTLISLQSILHDNGYKTIFINTEPSNKDFTKYLGDFNFDLLISDKSHARGAIKDITDSSAYDLLFDTIENYDDSKPYFIAMYTFGTHVSLDSPDKKFDDGKDPVLNRFYNLDSSFGQFFERLFSDVNLSKNTLLVFTTDHATYFDKDFRNAFPDYERASIVLDRIPLNFYCRGIKSENVDVNGRNSLALTPTVLDMMDISDENYFLGNSLFSDKVDFHDYVFESSGYTRTSRNAGISSLTSSELQSFDKYISEYYALKSGHKNDKKELLFPKAYCEVVGDKVVVSLKNCDKYKELKLAVWSERFDQDDLKWYSVQNPESSSDFSYEIPVMDFYTDGSYFVHIYGVKGNKSKCISTTGVFSLDYSERPAIFATVSEMKDSINVDLKNIVCENPLKLAVWSLENGQDDLHWYDIPALNGEDFYFEVPLVDFNTSGDYALHLWSVEHDNLKTCLMQRIIKNVDCPSIIATISRDENVINVSLKSLDSNSPLKLAVWSLENGQDDLKWYDIPESSGGDFSFEVPLSDFNTSGDYALHLWSYDNGEFDSCLATATINISK